MQGRQLRQTLGELLVEASPPGVGLKSVPTRSGRSSENNPASGATLVPVSGGDISAAYRVDRSAGPPHFFKWQPDPPEGFFQAEKAGLEALSAAGGLRIPICYAAAHNGILMEWLPTAGSQESQGEELGRGLARQHRCVSDRFGLGHDNFIGVLPQTNRPDTSWLRFFRDQRLGLQFETARALGRMNPSRERWAHRLLDRLPEWVHDGHVVPSLLHGDLWGGNWLATDQGPALIDPAVYYGDREIDLAMASLFGGFPRAFFQAYEEAYPLALGWEDRRPLYQLYYLLVHLNAFGESYGSQVDRILRRYGC